MVGAGFLCNQSSLSTKVSVYNHVRNHGYHSVVEQLLYFECINRTCVQTFQWLPLTKSPYPTTGKPKSGQQLHYKSVSGGDGTSAGCSDTVYSQFGMCSGRR